MNLNDIEAVARQLDAAAVNRSATDPLLAGYDCTLDEAYQIQRAAIGNRHARGERPIGVKLGFTSRAKMVQMGVDSLIWGLLTDAMLYEDSSEIALGDFIHPRAEPELCFLTRRDIDRPLTLIEAAGYLEGVAPAIEIIDSRYRDFKFSLADVVADNCSSAALVVGALRSMDTDLVNRGVLVRVNGRVVQMGSTAAILGNPLRSVVQASALASRAGMVLPAGSLIMAGAATAAEALRPGQHVQAEITGVGSVEFFTRSKA